MTELPNWAEQEAVLWGRESAAEQRAEKLSRATQALKNSLEKLAFEPDPNKVLGHMLISISDYLDSPASAFWILSRHGKRFQLQLSYERDAAEQVLPFNRRRRNTVWGLGNDLVLKDHVTLRKPVVYQMEELKEAHPKIHKFFRDLGIATLLGVPLLLGQQVLGSLTLRFSTPRTFEQDDLELTQAIAHQATMAIQITGLAKRDGEMALAEERARLSRDIHDTLAQGFTGILMQLGAASQVPGDRRSDIEPQLQAIHSLARTSLAEARRSVGALRQVRPAEPIELAERLETLLEGARLLTDASVMFDMSGPCNRLSSSVKSEVYWIVKEALNNAVKHSGARHINIVLVCQDSEWIHVSIQDDGSGFVPTAALGTDRTFGLTGMQERAVLIGASLTVITEKGCGTEIVLHYSKPEGSE